MSSYRKQIIELIKLGSIPTDKINDALSLSKVDPDGKSWLKFIDHLLLGVGGLAIAFSALFFIAYNWNDIGRFAKFGLIEVLIVLCILAYWKLDVNKFSGKVTLLVASILLGVLLALYGQTYQTGADPWQLFFNWALLIIPWVFIARFSAMWVFWLFLINLSTVLYYLTFRNIFWIVFDFDAGLYWLIFLFNMISLIVWEYLSCFYDWLSERWAARLIAITTGVSITTLVIFSIFEINDLSILPFVVWSLWLSAIYYIYCHKIKDLFMLAGGCLAVSVVIITFLARNMFSGSEVAGSFLILFLFVIGLGTGSAIWLRGVNREWQS